MKKIWKLLVLAAVVCTVTIACGNKDESSSSSSNGNASSGGGSSTSSTKTTETSTAATKAPNPITLKLYISNPEGTAWENALASFEQEEKFSHITLEMADKIADYDTKMSVMIASGTQVDIMSLENPIYMHNRASSGSVQPVDTYLNELGISAADVFGEREAEAMKVGGETYMIPYEQTKWLLLYNKDIFDNAGIAYPSATEAMTMNEYRELAKALTSGEGYDKTYGALTLTWPIYWYMPAILELGGGEAFYNANGLSNIEDPAFAKALQFSYDMQHLDKSVHTYADAKISQVKAISFMNGNYGMSILASWALPWFGQSDRFPRDWSVGVAPVPTMPGKGKQTFGVLGGLGIPVSSKHPLEATEVAVYLAEKIAEHTDGNIPAAKNYDPQTLLDAMMASFPHDGITEAELQAVLFDETMGFVSEKVTGDNASAYETVITEEVEKFFVQEQDLQTTIKNIKTRGDKVIQQ